MSEQYCFGRKNLQANRELRDGGFTLVELLIAVFIFAIVVSSVYGSYRATFHIVSGAESRLKVSHNARVAMERITEDLSSLVVGAGGDFRGETHEHSGNRGDNLAFVSAAHLVLSKGDVLTGHAKIQYSTEPDEETGLLNLYRSDMVLLPGNDEQGEEPKKHILCKGLQELRFTYLDEDGAESEEWQSSEGGELRSDADREELLLPSLVYVELRFAETMESETRTIFKTGVALPQIQRDEG